MRKLVLGVCAFIVGTSFLHADYKKPMSLASGVKATNLLVNYYSNDQLDADSSIVKIVDGCRVIYISGAYINNNQRLSTSSSSKNISIAVSDIGCK